MQPFGVASDGIFIGRVGCGFDLNRGEIPKVAWANVDYFNMQVQVLASDETCGGLANLTTYVLFVQQAAAIVRAQNPKIVISAQLSFRDSSATTMQAFINDVRGIADAIYFAYPRGSCPSCTPANLGAVLNSL